MRMHVALALAVGSLLGLAAWAATWSSTPPTAQAQGSLTRYVAPTGTDAGDCADPAQPCATVQYAVDQAAWGDEVHIATGVYTDVHQRAGITQTVYISKTVTLRGGYPADFSGPPDPNTHPTTLDAQGRGRVLVITGAISPTVEGLRITGGNAAGLSSIWGKWFGGGIHALTATITLNNNRIFSNTAGYGGGICLISNTATLIDNTVITNTAHGGGGVYLALSSATLNGNIVAANTAAESGGGLRLDGSKVTLNDNIITANTARHHGGGLWLHSSDVTLNHNTVATNTATDEGGGLLLWQCTATLNGNIISANTTGYGGGIYLRDSTATLDGNAIIANTATSRGGGIDLSYSTATLTGNLIIINTAGYQGGGLYLSYSGDSILSNNVVTSNTAQYGGGVCLVLSDPVLDENVIISNTAEAGGGVYLFYDSHAVLTNNLIADNRACIGGSGLHIRASSPRLLHNTIAHNDCGSGVYVTDYASMYSSVALTNTILVSHTIGISVTGGNTVTVNGVLWHDTPITIAPAATATVTVQNQHWGDPAFLNPAAGDYHLGPTSAARDMGIDAGVYTDIDGEPRPYQLPDMGADEYWPPGALKRLYLPLIWRS